MHTATPAAAVPLPAMAAAVGVCLLLGDGITDDVLVTIARFLPAKGLRALQLTCPRFAAKCIIAPSGASAGAAPEMLSIPEAAARLRVAGCSEQERGWVPRDGESESFQSLLGLLQQVEVLRLPLAFGRAHADLTLSEGGGVATKITELLIAGGGYRAAASTVAMHSGRHFAQFTWVEGSSMKIGIRKMMKFAFKMMDFALKNDEFCVKT